MAKRRGRMDEVHVAYIAISAAIVTATAYIPMFPVVGAGTVISAGMIAVPLVGILLGPVAGTLATAIGAFLGQIVAPYGAIFGLITFLCPMMGAFVSSLVAFKRWKDAALTLSLTILLWYAITSIKWAKDPYSSVRWYFPYLHLTSLASLFIFREKIGDWIESLDPKKVPFGIFLAALAGLLTDHMVGNSIYVGVYSGPARVYSFVLLLYSFERIAGAIGAALVGAPLLIALYKARIGVGPWSLRR